jgi:5-methylcytosine-specific restriction endonuclease McrA
VDLRADAAWRTAAMTCLEEGCTNIARARGWCSAHYLRWWRSLGDNAAKDRARNRANYLARREQELERKRAYYQAVRKDQDKTEVGRWRDRQRKAKRRALIAGDTVSMEEWIEICSAHDHRCKYCGERPEVLEMDHVVALSLGGKHEASNIVPACKPCNSSKGARW